VTAYIEPVSEIEDIQEGDVLELDGDLFLARNDGEYVGDEKQMQRQCIDYGVLLVGPHGGQGRCMLTENPNREQQNTSPHLLFQHYELGRFMDAPEIEQFKRCFRTHKSIE